MQVRRWWIDCIFKLYDSIAHFAHTQVKLCEGRLLWLWLLLFCQISVGFGFKWTNRWNPTLWNSRRGSIYHQQLPLNSLGKRIMTLSTSNSSPTGLDASVTSSLDIVVAKDDLPASKGTPPSNWL